GRGILTLALETARGKVDRVKVNMGRPILEASKIPTSLAGDPPVRQRLTAGGRDFEVTCVSMGNPHCIMFVERLSDEWVLSVGPEVERHPAFPNRVNAEFVEVVSPREVQMRVWERGSGETQACGTGACAATVAGVLTGLTERRVLAHLPGGDLELEWSGAGEVYLTGPAVEVFNGQW